MTKFHINVATGQSGQCTATPESCTYGAYGIHFESKAQAEQFSFLTQVSGEHLSGSIEPSETILKAQAQLAELIQNKAYGQLRTMVNQRASSKSFQMSLEERQGLKGELDLIGKRLEKAKARTKLVNRAVAAKARLDERDLSLEFRNKYEEMRYIWAQLNEYRVITAQAALASSILQENAERAEGTYLEYSGARIGELESLGTFEANSPEWHAARTGGIGGSDVGAIMRVDKTWGSVNFSRVVHSKLGIEDPANAAIDRNDLRSGIGRGNAWEEYIRQTFALKHPQLNVAFCKISWHGTEFSYRHANFDGLILDESGIPEGVIEIKTGSDPSMWGPVKNGLAGVPAGYRKQTLWYAMNGGLKYGKIVVLLDDHDYREYDFTMSDPNIQAELDEMIEATDEFWLDIQAKRKKLAAGLVLTRKKRSRGMKTSHDYANIAEVYAGYAGITRTEAKRQLVKAIEAEKVLKNRSLTDEEFQVSAIAVFAKHNPLEREKPLIGVDLETTTTSPRTGRIIETGIARLDQNGTTNIIYSSMHDIPERAKAGVGLGQYAIHHITPEMIAGAPSFDDPLEQERILTYLKSGTLVAHNAGFEDRFFTANLPGYAEAKNSGEITVLDTRRLSSFLMPTSEDSSLQSFAEDNGIPYEGAHAATADAVMMMKALARLQTSLFQTGVFKIKNITNASRLKAQKSAIKSNETR